MAQMGVETTQTIAPGRRAVRPAVRDGRRVARRRDARHDAPPRRGDGEPPRPGRGRRLAAPPDVAEQATAGIGTGGPRDPAARARARRRLSTGLHYSFLVTALAMDDAARTLDATLAARLGAGPVPPRDVLLHELDTLRTGGLPHGLRQGAAD